MDTDNEIIERELIDGIKVSLARHASGSTKASSSDWICIVVPTSEDTKRSYWGIPVGTARVFSTRELWVSVKAYEMLLAGRTVGEVVRVIEELYSVKLETWQGVYDNTSPDGDYSEMTLLDLARAVQVASRSRSYNGGS